MNTITILHILFLGAIKHRDTSRVLSVMTVTAPLCLYGLYLITVDCWVGDHNNEYNQACGSYVVDSIVDSTYIKATL